MRLDPFAGLSAVAMIMMAGCVTINIYFPAAAAEKAADRIIDQVWQLKPGEGAKGAEAKPAAPPSTKEAQ